MIGPSSDTPFESGHHPRRPPRGTEQERSRARLTVCDMTVRLAGGDAGVARTVLEHLGLVEPVGRVAAVGRLES